MDLKTSEKNNHYLQYINRSENYRKNISTNYIEILQNSRLSLRKEKLNDLIQMKRINNLEETRNLKNINSEKISMCIDIKNINPPKPNRNEVEEKSINDRFFNLSLNKSFDFNQIYQILDKCINELSNYNITAIHLYKIDELKLCVLKLRNLFLCKDITIHNSFYLNLYDSMFTILEKYSEYINYDIELIFETLWCLTNLSVICPENEINDIIITREFFKTLEFYLNSHNLKIREQTLWCYGNLIGDSITLRDNFFSQKILLKVLSVINDIKSNNGIIKIGMWLISQISKGSTAPKYEDMSMCIVTVTSNLWSNDEEVVVYVLQILTYLSFSDNQYCELILSTNCIKKIIDFAYIKKKKFYLSCFRILGNLLSLENSSETILNNGILKLFTNYLVIDDTIILREVMWCINQLSESPSKIINLILNDEIFVMNLLDLLKSNINKKKSFTKMKIEVLKIFINYLKIGDIQTVEYFLQHNIILGLKSILTGNYDPTLFFCCVLIIQKILIYGKSSKLLRNKIIKILYLNDFKMIFEKIYFHHNNLNLNKVIDKILNICNNEDMEQMIL